MNIQIFGRAKCFDTQKAERYFKERKIPFQRIDLLRYGLSAGEFRSVCRAVGGWQALLDPHSHDETAVLIHHLADPQQAASKLMAHPQCMRSPIVRNGRKATVGYQPEQWKAWYESS